MNERKIEQKLHEVLLSLYHRTGRAMGYWPNYFHREVKEKGGLAVARRLLRPEQGRTDGFERLAEAKRADLSVEAIILKEPFRALFTSKEIEEAETRLAALPRDAFPRHRKGEIHGEEIGEEEDFAEGQIVKVKANRYERSRKARAACIRHHGTRCVVCGFDFEARYGSLGEGFIHVHHVVPLPRARKRKVNPKRDLVPVCPNCHAMLHRRDPPLDVEELRDILSGWGAE